MSPHQRDFLIEAADRAAAGPSTTLRTVLDRLPASQLLVVSDIASALDVDVSLVYSWIDAGKFPVLNLGSGPTGRPYYKVDRAVLIDFLKNRIQ